MSSLEHPQAQSPDFVLIFGTSCKTFPKISRRRDSVARHYQLQETVVFKNRPSDRADSPQTYPNPAYPERRADPTTPWSQYCPAVEHRSVSWELFVRAFGTSKLPCLPTFCPFWNVLRTSKPRFLSRPKNIIYANFRGSYHLLPERLLETRPGSPLQHLCLEHF